MDVNDTIERMLQILKSHSENILDLCNVVEKMIECMAEIEERVTTLENKRHRGRRDN